MTSDKFNDRKLTLFLQKVRDTVSMFFWNGGQNLIGSSEILPHHASLEGVPNNASEASYNILVNAQRSCFSVKYLILHDGEK